jgi:hypothetical protein
MLDCTARWGPRKGTHATRAVRTPHLTTWTRVRTKRRTESIQQQQNHHKIFRKSHVKTTRRYPRYAMFSSYSINEDGGGGQMTRVPREARWWLQVSCIRLIRLIRVIRVIRILGLLEDFVWEQNTTMRKLCFDRSDRVSVRRHPSNPNLHENRSREFLRKQLMSSKRRSVGRCSMKRRK